MDDSDFYRLRDPIPADPFLPAASLPWWVWILIALAAVALIVIILRLFRRRKALACVDPSIARRRALAALEKIDPSHRAAEVATAISLILRRFLADTLGDPSLFETHEEFLARHASLDGLPDDQRQQTRDHFASLAHLKYGPDTEADAQALLSDSRTLLQNLHPAPKQPSTHRTPPQLPHPAS